MSAPCCFVCNILRLYALVLFVHFSAVMRLIIVGKADIMPVIDQVFVFLTLALFAFYYGSK